MSPTTNPSESRYASYEKAKRERRNEMARRRRQEIKLYGKPKPPTLEEVKKKLDEIDTEIRVNNERIRTEDRDADVYRSFRLSKKRRNWVKLYWELKNNDKR